MTPLDRAWAFTFREEVDPKDTDKVTTDTGGLTKYGVSQRAYPSVDIAALTVDDAKALFERDYWDKAGCGDLDARLSLVHADTAYNMGVSRANIILAASEGDVDDYLLKRIAYYVALATKNKQKYGPYFLGWVGRAIRAHNEVDA